MGSHQVHGSVVATIARVPPGTDEEGQLCTHVVSSYWYSGSLMNTWQPVSLAVNRQCHGHVWQLKF